MRARGGGVEITLQVGRLWRNLAALALAAVACIVALFGGALLGCAAQGMTPSCATDGILVSPVLLFGAGIGASLLARGWIGLSVVAIGVLVGMAAIPIVASIAGNPVPIDPVQGVIATIWFMPPVLVGYGTGRGVARLRARSRGAREPRAD
jgi:hypothetical protein